MAPKGWSGIFVHDSVMEEFNLFHIDLMQARRKKITLSDALSETVKLARKELERGNDHSDDQSP